MSLEKSRYIRVVVIHNTVIAVIAAIGAAAAATADDDDGFGGFGGDSDGGAQTQF